MSNDVMGGEGLPLLPLLGLDLPVGQVLPEVGPEERCKRRWIMKMTVPKRPFRVMCCLLAMHHTEGPLGQSHQDQLDSAALQHILALHL